MSDVSRTARPPDPRGLRRFATHRRNRPHSSLRSSCRLRRDGCEERVIAAEHPSQRPKTRPTFLRLVSRPFPTVTFLLTSSQSVNRVFSIHISFPSTHLTFGSDREWRSGDNMRQPMDDVYPLISPHASLNPRSVPPLVFRSLSLHIQDSFKS